MTTPLRQPRRMSRDPGSATRRTPSQTGIPRPRSGSQSGIPMASSRTAANRQGATQPTYDFLAGGSSDPEPPKIGRASLRQSTSVVRPDAGNEDLRAQLRTLQYELDSLKQDKEVTGVRHEKELRDAQAKAEADFKRAQASESSSHVATGKYDALARELKELQDASTNRRHDLEKRLRTAQEEARSSKEDLDEAQSAIAQMEREQNYKGEELQKKHTALQRTVDDIQSDRDSKAAELQRVQARLTTQEKDYGELESDVLRLKAQIGEAEERGTLQTQLSEQVNHIRILEKTNNDQLAELKRLRETHKSVGIVEEEKRALERKVQRMKDLDRELGEAKFRTQMLEEERKSWTSFLQGDSNDDSSPEFDSPEEMSRALAEERMERATLAERLGAVQPTMAEQEQLIDDLAKENKRLKTEYEKYKASSQAPAASTTDSRSKIRLERQRNLLVKEVEYLRAQLKTFESEDTTQDVEAPATMDEQARKRITELEELITQYRGEVETVTKELASTESAKPVEPEAKSNKRPLPQEEEPESEQLGTLSRKNRKLQDELAAAHQRSAMLDRELEGSKSQITSLQELTRMRVLSLRNNPTDDFEKVKLSQLRTLRTENEGLHALLERKQISDSVPRASLAAKDQEVEEWKAKVAERDKRMLRLRQSWSAKALELRQAVASILGWRVEFAPNGKFKLSSIFYPQGDDTDDSEGGLGSNYLIFDGEKGTVQVSGGPDGEFARDIKGLVKFWVEGRKEIPGLMAACTLEFYERTTRAMRI